jgi:hypothetical protein
MAASPLMIMNLFLPLASKSSRRCDEGFSKWLAGWRESWAKFRTRLVKSCLSPLPSAPRCWEARLFPVPGQRRPAGRAGASAAGCRVSNRVGLRRSRDNTGNSYGAISSVDLERALRAGAALLPSPSLKPCDRGRQGGKIRSDLQADATFLLSSWQGAMMRMKVDRSRKPIEQFKRVLFATVLATPAGCHRPD